jgi:hypothetical protein
MKPRATANCMPSLLDARTTASMAFAPELRAILIASIELFAIAPSAIFRYRTSDDRHVSLVVRVSHCRASIHVVAGTRHREEASAEPLPDLLHGQRSIGYDPVMDILPFADRALAYYLDPQHRSGPSDAERKTDHDSVTELEPLGFPHPLLHGNDVATFF